MDVFVVGAASCWLCQAKDAGSESERLVIGKHSMGVTHGPHGSDTPSSKNGVVVSFYVLGTDGI